MTEQSTPKPTITVRFTVSTSYEAEIDPQHFPLLPASNGDDDDHAEAIERFLSRHWTHLDLLREYYGISRNWDGSDAEVEIDDVQVQS